MRTRLLATTAGLCLITATSAAQNPLPSAPLQMGWPGAPIAGRDVFRAAPDTYAPRFEEPPAVDPRLVPCCGGGFLGPVFYVPVDPWWAVRPPVSSPAPEAPPAPSRPAPPRAAPGPGGPASPLPPPVPGVPKTFYVIPRCYAGDKPPEPGALPPGCDLAALRIIPPSR